MSDELRLISTLLNLNNAQALSEQERVARAMQLNRAIEADKEKMMLNDSLQLERTKSDRNWTKTETEKAEEREEKRYSRRVDEEDKQYERRVAEADKKRAEEQALKEKDRNRQINMALFMNNLKQEAERDAGKYDAIKNKMDLLKEEQAILRGFSPNVNKIRRNAGQFFTESPIGGLTEEEIISGYMNIAGDSFTGRGGQKTFDGLRGLVNKAKLFESDARQNMEVRSLLDSFIGRMADIGYERQDDGSISGTADTWGGLGENEENTAQMRNILSDLLNFKSSLESANPYSEFGISPKDKEFYDDYDFGQSVLDKEREMLKGLLSQ